MPDNYRSDWGFLLFSERLIQIICDQGIQFEAFPAVMHDYKTDAVLPVRYSVFRLLEAYPGLDRAQSVPHKPIVLTQECLDANRPFFMLAEEHRILISASLKAIFEEAKITGCEYKSVSEYRSLSR